MAWGMILSLVAMATTRTDLALEGAIGLDGTAATIHLDRSPATVLVFVTPDCPIANRYAPEIERIHQDYRGKGVQFRLVYPAELRYAAMIREHTAKFNLTISPLLDPNRIVVRRLEITVSPEAAVFDRAGVLQYRGRIDDRNIEHGKFRPNYRRDLRQALDEMLAGKPVSLPRTTAVGCFIDS